MNKLFVPSSSCCVCCLRLLSHFFFLLLLSLLSISHYCLFFSLSDLKITWFVFSTHLPLFREREREKERKEERKNFFQYYSWPDFLSTLFWSIFLTTFCLSLSLSYLTPLSLSLFHTLFLSFLCFFSLFAVTRHTICVDSITLDLGERNREKKIKKK